VTFKSRVLFKGVLFQKRVTYGREEDTPAGWARAGGPCGIRI